MNHVNNENTRQWPIMVGLWPSESIFKNSKIADPFVCIQRDTRTVMYTRFVKLSLFWHKIEMAIFVMSPMTDYKDAYSHFEVLLVTNNL